MDKPGPRAGGRSPRWAGGARNFMIFVVALALTFLFLGLNQAFEHARNERLQAIITERAGGAPIDLPPVAEWVGFDPQVYDFRPLRLTGTFDHDATILVATELENPKGEASGPGFWIVAPLYLEGGGIIFVNRGFVPESLARGFADGGAAPPGKVTITGLGRASERQNPFTPGTDFASRTEYLNSVERFSRFLEEGAGPVAPVYLDQGPTPPGALPQGGETVTQTGGRHFEFALIWFFLAALTPLLLLVWLRKKP